MPWVKVDEIQCNLSPVGLIYHVVFRGLNAYLAVGLMFLTLVVFVSLHCGVQCGSCLPFGRHGTCHRAKVDRFIFWLAMCALAGPSLLFAHGAGLYFDAVQNGQSDNIVKAMVDRGWLGWLSASFVSTYFLLSSAFWLYARNREGVNEYRAMAYEELEAVYAAQSCTEEEVLKKTEAQLRIEAYSNCLKNKAIAGFPALLGGVSIILQVAGVLVPLFAAV